MSEPMTAAADAARDQIADSAKLAQEAADATSAAARDAMENAQEATSATRSALLDQPLAQEWMALLREGFERNVAAWNAIAGSRSAPEVVEIQSQWLRDSVSAMTEGGQRLATASLSAMRSFKPPSFTASF